MNNYYTTPELAELIRARFIGMPENEIEKCVRNIAIPDDPVFAVTAHIRRRQPSYGEAEILAVLSGWESPKGSTRAIAANFYFTR